MDRHAICQAMTSIDPNTLWGTLGIDVGVKQYDIQTLLPASFAACGCLQDKSLVPYEFYQSAALQALKVPSFSIPDGAPGAVIYLWYHKGAPIITALYPAETDKSLVKPLHDVTGAKMLRDFWTWSLDQKCSCRRIISLSMDAFDSKFDPKYPLKQEVMKAMIDLKEALENNDEHRITEICTKKEYATHVLKLRDVYESPVVFNLSPGMPQYPFPATNLLDVTAGTPSAYSQLAAQHLCNNGADLNSAAWEDIAPIHIASRHENTDMVAFLIERGANLEARSITGKTALQFAAWAGSCSGNIQCSKILIQAGADINAANSDNFTPLLWAVGFGSKPAVIELLLSQPNIDKYSSRKSTGQTAWTLFHSEEERRLGEGREPRLEILQTLKKHRFGPNCARMHKL